MPDLNEQPVAQANPPISDEQIRERVQSLGKVAAAGALLQGIGRMKTWDELTVEEKLDRLRDCLRSKDMAVQDLRAQVGALGLHQHGEGGQILVPLYNVLGQGSMGGRVYDPLA